MNIYIYAYTYICIYIYVYTCTYAYIFIHINTYIYTNIHTHVHVIMYIYMYVYLHTDIHHCVPRHVRRPLKSQTTRTLHLLNTWGGVMTKMTKSSYQWREEPCKEAA